MSIEFKIYRFDELSPSLLYDILQLRQQVFIIEQNCFYLDADGKDAQSWHLCAFEKGNLVGYARVLPPGLSYKTDASIGRVVLVPTHRGTGLGRKLMLKSMAICQEQYPNAAIALSSQCYAESFYGSLGFNPVGDPYEDAGIMHIKMRLRPSAE